MFSLLLVEQYRNEKLSSIQFKFMVDAVQYAELDPFLAYGRTEQWAKLVDIITEKIVDSPSEHYERIRGGSNIDCPFIISINDGIATFMTDANYTSCSNHTRVSISIPMQACLNAFNRMRELTASQ